MENKDEKRFINLIFFSGLLSMGLASLVGLFVLINVLQMLSIASLLLFIAGIVATAISYLVTVVGGVPLPGPKKRLIGSVSFITLLIALIILFLMIRDIHGADIYSLLYLIAGISGTGISYVMSVSGGVLPPGPKGR